MAGSDNKQKIMLIAAVALFLVAGFLIYWFNFRSEATPAPDGGQPAPAATTGTEPGAANPTPTPPPPGGGRRTNPTAGGN